MIMKKYLSIILAIVLVSGFTVFTKPGPDDPVSIPFYGIERVQELEMFLHSNQVTIFQRKPYNTIRNNCNKRTLCCDHSFYRGPTFGIV